MVDMEQKGSLVSATQRSRSASPSGAYPTGLYAGGRSHLRYGKRDTAADEPLKRNIFLKESMSDNNLGCVFRLNCELFLFDLLHGGSIPKSC